MSLLHSAALSAACLLAFAGLQGCNKSNTAAGGESGTAAEADQGGPNGYAPAGGYAQEGAASPSPSAGGAQGSRRERGGEGGGYENAGYYVDSPPPPIPEYDQPPPPGDGYYWTPGYWGWSRGDSDYYWVPGTWVQPPEPSQYWTPGYWAYVNGGYTYYGGYWGPVVGYYGGVDYGWGYDGRGYAGGRWQNNHFAYNSAVNNLSSVRVTNVYREDAQTWTHNRASYSGGPGGLRVAPTPQQISAAQARHIQATPMQAQQRTLAEKTPGLRASVNQGRPTVVATARPGAFQGPGVVTQVKSEPHYTPPAHIQAAAHPPAAPQGHGGPAPAMGPAAVREAPHEGAPAPAAPPAREARPAPAEPARIEGARPDSRAAAPEARTAPAARPAPEARTQEHAPPPRPAEHAAPPPRPVERAAPPPRPVEPAAPPRPVEHAAPPKPEAAHPAPPHPEQHPTKPEDRPHGQG